MQSSTLLHHTDQRRGIQRWSMATMHTTFQKIHSEVASVLKLSRSSLAKPDKSASVRVSAQKALPKLIPSLPCFPAFVFLLLIGRLGLEVEGGWVHEKCVCPEGKVQRRVFKDSLCWQMVVMADRQCLTWRRSAGDEFSRDHLPSHYSLITINK